MTTAVAEAISEIRAALPEVAVAIREDGDGGVFVTIETIDPGVIYTHRESWIAFQITFQYPYSDVYPLFVRPDLTRVDGRELGEGFAVTQFEGQPATQLSRRSNKLDPGSDTAVIKLIKVLEWLRTR